MFPTEAILHKTQIFWQYPVITEKEFYNQNKDDETFIGFPWATIIDKNINPSIIYKLLKPYLPSNHYYTCCQHIYFRHLIPLLKTLNITTLYTPHKVKNENVMNGVNIKPCPLYAVNIEDPAKNISFRNVDLLNKERPILYSFKGGY